MQDDINFDEIERVYNVNAIGAIRMSKAALNMGSTIIHNQIRKTVAV